MDWIREVPRAADGVLYDKKKGIYRVKGGDGYIQIVRYSKDKGAEILSVNAYGASDRPDSEALIRSSLGNTFDKAWIKLVQNPTTGVMAGTLYMAGQIEGNLAGSAEVPSVSSGGSTVDWSPPEATNQQFDPQPYAGE